MSLTKLFLGGNYDVIYKLFLPRESLESNISARHGNIEKLFYVVTLRRRKYLRKVRLQGERKSGQTLFAQSLHMLLGCVSRPCSIFHNICTQCIPVDAIKAKHSELLHSLLYKQLFFSSHQNSQLQEKYFSHGKKCDIFPKFFPYAVECRCVDDSKRY
jgi:hypothetical protein